jgi:hypothetical protein
VTAVRRFPSWYDDTLGVGIAWGAPQGERRGAGRVKFVTVTNLASQAKADVLGFYFFTPAGDTGTFTTPWHFPSAVLVPMTWTEASHGVPVG